MKNNLQKRIYTSLALFLILFLILMNNYLLGYFLIIIGLFSTFEFSNIISKIFSKFKIKSFLINLFFIIYIFSFCAIFLSLSNFAYLKIIIFVMLLTCVFSDIGGYVFGKIFKGPKLTSISPNKTINGSIGSFLFSSIFLSLSIYFLTGNFNYKIVLIGCITSMSCQIGDLFFSYLKRKSKLKDTGNFLPGHGGILDRIDGLLFGLPIGMISLTFIY